MPPDDRDLCPHPRGENVICPECRSDIPGVIAGATSDDPEPRCPECEAKIDDVILE